MGTRGKWQWTDGRLFLPPLTEGQPRPHVHEGTSVLVVQVGQPILMEWCELVGLYAPSWLRGGAAVKQHALL